MGAVTRRPLVVLGVTAALALGGAALALRLEPSAATETLVDRGSDTFKDTERFKRDFGDEAVLVLVRGELTRTSSPPTCGGSSAWRAASAGTCRTPRRGWGSLPQVCRDIAELDPAKVVYGPGTFINTAVEPDRRRVREAGGAATEQAQQAAEAARRLSKRRGDPPAEQERLAAGGGAGGPGEVHQRRVQARAQVRPRRAPRSIDDPDFVSTLVFDRTAGRAGRAEVALRLPVPVEELRADPDPPAAGPHRLGARPRDRADPHGHRREACSSRARARATS